MGLMLDALKQIEVRTSVPAILPLSKEPETWPAQCGWNGGDAADEPGWFDDEGLSIADPVEDDHLAPRPMFVAGQPVPWPEGRAGHAPFYEKTADAILHQLSRGEDISDRFLQQPAVIAFTSAADGDGKTSVLTGLAPHLATKLATGLLVVDANERKPDLSETLGMPAWQAAEAGPALIYPTCVSGLNVLPASSCWKSLSWIDDLRQTWPLVLLDTPSLLHPEMGPMARCCDGVYLVVRLGHTPRRAVRQAARTISQSGGKLLGSIVVI